MYLIAIAANQNSDNQWTSGDTEFQGYWHSGNGDRQGSENDTNNDTNEYGCNVWSIQSADAVAHLVGYAVYSIFRTYNHDAVTYLQRQ